jgi:hypothetical protein
MAKHDPNNPYDQGDEDDAPAAGGGAYDFGEPEGQPGGQDYMGGRAVGATPYSAPTPDVAYDMEADHNAKAAPVAAAYDMQAHDPDADLARMYVKKERGEVGTPGLVIQEGPPPPEPRSYVWVAVTLVVILVLAGLAAVVIFVRPGIVLPNGDRGSLPLYAWVPARLTMTPEQAALQGLSDDELAFVVTRGRIARVQAGSVKFLLRSGRAPRSGAELAEAGLADTADLVDGWQQEFAFEQDGADIIVRSLGRDGILRNSDDLVQRASSLTMPPEFEALQIEQSGSF